MTDPRAPLPGFDRVPLDHGAILAMVVDNTGEPWPWLLNPGGDTEQAGCRCPICCAHDQPGDLPGLYAARLRLAFCRQPPPANPDEQSGAT